MKKIKKNNLIGLGFLLPLIFLSIIFIILPIINAVSDSFKEFSRYDLVNYNLGIKNFNDLTTNSFFQAAFANSNIVLWIGVPIGLGVGFMLAILLSLIRFNFLQNSVITLIFSQFFLSSFAVGIAFIYLFDVNSDLFNKIFHTKVNWTGNGSHSNAVAIMVFFHVWRIAPFNAVIILFNLVWQKNKYQKVLKIDNLTLGQTIKNIYLPNLKKTFLLLLYLNIFEALLLNSSVIFNPDVIINNQTWTISYFIYYYLKVLNVPNFSISSAAAIVFLAYLIFIFLSLLIGFLTIKKWNPIKQKGVVWLKKFF